ncbi:hypothetical protein CALCODRAFT_17531 [Calocera cornea HHB12733]|uniref:Uncharacterized protein n=1 Tax=Calocera cornea HHB12733 TaxID=1353952 RepID=A0A165E7X5_9BASI|nr:hypothetical protein CALCODRAFT_17531 [Calocera cornea HHB12733]
MKSQAVGAEYPYSEAKKLSSRNVISLVSAPPYNVRLVSSHRTACRYPRGNSTQPCLCAALTDGRCCAPKRAKAISWPKCRNTRRAKLLVRHCASGPGVISAIASPNQGTINAANLAGGRVFARRKCATVAFSCYPGWIGKGA